MKVKNSSKAIQALRIIVAVLAAAFAIASAGCATTRPIEQPPVEVLR